MKAAILHPEWLDVQTLNGVVKGYNQEWYGTEWQRISGCGPTTATTIVNYLFFRENLMQVEDYQSEETILPMMDRIWQYVQPRRGGGLFKARWFEEGLTAFFEENNYPYKAELLSIGIFSKGKSRADEVAQFVMEGLRDDVPVAFLNRHRGDELGLETWHWVPIIAMEEREGIYWGTVLDDGKSREFSLQSWLDTTMFGGGFVRVHKK